jgi:glycosyltransferase involved in cell wall biosynthesis
MLQEAFFRRYERQEYPHFGMVAVVGEDDARHLRQVRPGLDVRVIGIPLPAAFQAAPIRSFATAPGVPRILVTGSLSDLGVAHGVGQFLEECSAYMAGTSSGSVTVLGVNPHPRLVAIMRRLAFVQHIDFVKDYPAFLSQDWVYVYPQKCGTGLQTKLQQAIGLGLPAVGYQLSFGGLGTESGTHAFACCTPDELHGAVERLLSDVALRRTIGTAGAHHVRQRFAGDVVGESLVELYREVVWRSE